MTDVQFDPETGEVLSEAPVPHPPAKKKRARKKASTRQPIPADETRRQKFLRLVNHRFDRIVHAMHVMRALGRNQASYEYGDADIDRIFDLLVAELEQMAAEMRRRGRPAQTKLDLQ